MRARLLSLLAALLFATAAYAAAPVTTQVSTNLWTTPCTVNQLVAGGGAALPVACVSIGTGVATALGNNVNASGGIVSPTPAAAGDLIYWNGSAWVKFAGNNSGTQTLQENASGVPSWVTISGSGTVTSIALAGGLTGSANPITSTGTIYTPGGFLNRFRNGEMGVWQRGTSALATSASAPGAYTADGWQVQQTGAQGSCAQDTGTAAALYSLKCSGATSNTDTVISQPIESIDANGMAGNVATAQFWYKQTSGISATPKILTCYASATDAFATCTPDLSATSLTACATATWCLESYTLSVSASASKGYRISLDCNVALGSGGACWITAADVRPTPGVATGVNANPGPPELSFVAADMLRDQRYYYRRSAASSTDVLCMGQSYAANAFFAKFFDLPVTMRAVPVVSISSFTHLSAFTPNGASAVAAQASGSSAFVASLNSVSNYGGISVVSSSLSVGAAAMIEFNTSSGWIDATAEL